MPPDDNDDRRARDVVATTDELDDQTKADLARWFGLPSFQQVEEAAAKQAAAAPPDTMDPEIRARIEAQARATAAIDPALVDALHARARSVEALLTMPSPPPPTLDPSISAVDPVLLARANAVVEPRELDVSWVHQLMNDPTPQAVLRDLHRPVTTFPLYLEVDPVVQSLTAPTDVFAEVHAAVTTRLAISLPPLPFHQAMAAYQVLVQVKRDRWSEIRTPNRRVSE